jgi:hypothetical protein
MAARRPKKLEDMTIDELRTYIRELRKLRNQAYEQQRMARLRALYDYLGRLQEAAAALKMPEVVTPGLKLPDPVATYQALAGLAYIPAVDTSGWSTAPTPPPPEAPPSAPKPSEYAASFTPLQVRITPSQDKTRIAPGEVVTFRAVVEYMWPAKGIKEWTKGLRLDPNWTINGIAWGGSVEDFVQVLKFKGPIWPSERTWTAKWTGSAYGFSLTTGDMVVTVAAASTDQVKAMEDLFKRMSCMTTPWGKWVTGAPAYKILTPAQYSVSSQNKIFRDQGYPVNVTSW